MKKYFSYNPEDGMTFHDTLRLARDAFNIDAKDWYGVIFDGVCIRRFYHHLNNPTLIQHFPLHTHHTMP